MKNGIKLAPGTRVKLREEACTKDWERIYNFRKDVVYEVVEDISSNDAILVSTNPEFPLKSTYRGTKDHMIISRCYFEFDDQWLKEKFEQLF